MPVEPLNLGNLEGPTASGRDQPSFMMKVCSMEISLKGLYLILARI